MQDRRASAPNGWHDNGPNWNRRAPKRSSASRSSAFSTAPLALNLGRPHAADQAATVRHSLVQAVVAMAQAVHSARFGNFSHTFWQAMQMVPTTLAKAGPN